MNTREPDLRTYRVAKLESGFGVAAMGFETSLVLSSAEHTSEFVCPICVQVSMNLLNFGPSGRHDF